MMNNRDEFLKGVASSLGRSEVRHVAEPMPQPAHNYAESRLTELSPQQRLDAFVDFATNTMLVHCELTSEADAPQAAQRLCEKYGEKPVVISGDERLKQLGITQHLQQAYGATVWDPALGEENIHLSEQAKVGVVHAEYGFTESAGIVLFSAPERGQSLSLLPESSIFVVRKSTILPRIAQLAQKLHQMAQEGQRMPSCINIIGGPSSTADIELIKVIGVHGPIHAAYLIIEDC